MTPEIDANAYVTTIFGLEVYRLMEIISEYKLAGVDLSALIKARQERDDAIAKLEQFRLDIHHAWDRNAVRPPAHTSPQSGTQGNIVGRCGCGCHTGLRSACLYCIDNHRGEKPTTGICTCYGMPLLQKCPICGMGGISPFSKP